jgi:hypothetical protein
MRDLITYAPDVTALVQELSVKLPKYLAPDNQGGYVFMVPKTPTKRVGDGTLSLVRAQTAEEEALLNSLDSVQVLGTREEVFADQAKLDIYRQFYPAGSRTATVFGVEVEIQNPEIPVFA